MKKILSLILTLVVGFSSMSFSLAFAEDAITVTIDDVVQSYEVSPVIKDGRALVPVRAIFESLGAKVEWDGEARTVTGKTDDITVVLAIDSTEATVNDEKTSLDVPAQIIDSYTFVPARFVSEALKYDVEWIADTKTVAITTGKPKLISTLPETAAQEAVIKRARMMADFTWTPVATIPTRKSSVLSVFEPGKEYTGIIYSSNAVNSKPIGHYTSFETYLTALANPDSVMYTKTLSSQMTADAYYGMVCNEFVRYCLGIKERYDVNNFFSIPGMKVVKEKGEYTVDEIKLCDILIYYTGPGKGHVTIVTDILKDEEGNVAKIEVSESTPPLARRISYTPEEFYKKWEKYRLGRYEYLENVPLFDEEEWKLLYESDLATRLPKVAVNFGNKANYPYGEETLISVFDEGENVVQVYKDGELLSETKTSGRARFAQIYGKGRYQVKLKDSEEYVEFCVCKPEISFTFTEDTISVKASSGDDFSKISYLEFRDPYNATVVAEVNLTEEEKESGEFTREIIKSSHPHTAFQIHFENEYGMWTHEMIVIE